MNPPIEVDERRFLRDLLGALDSSSTPDAVVLIGSWVRGPVLAVTSDIDVLVVGERPALRIPPRFQVIDISLDALKRRALSGDDFVQWALRFGEPIHGRALWERLRNELRDLPWPDPDAKRTLATARVRTGLELLQMGDIEAAQEELLYAVSHVARAILLKEQVFPLSRPELPAQLRSVWREELAVLLEVLASGEQLDAERLRTAFETVRVFV